MAQLNIGSLNYIDITQDFNLLLVKMQNNFIQKIYFDMAIYFFDFSTISFKEIKEKKDIFKSIFFNFLDNCKFFTFEISNIESNKCNDFEAKNVNATFCVEKKVFILESINFNLLLFFLNETKSVSIVNVSENLNGLKTTLDDNLAVEEVSNFCDKINKYIINSHKFIRNSIKAVVSYLIRRYFQPSYFFNDQSFFLFSKQPNIVKEKNIKEKLLHLIKTNDCGVIVQNEKDIENEIENETKINEVLNDQVFNENEFIVLRRLYTSSNKFIDLVFHCPSFYIFALKQVNEPIYYEVNFVQKYSHRCILNFYGFLKKEEKIIGFVYEYMSNGSLYDYIMNKENKKCSTFEYTAMIRILQGINFIKSNSLVHRDLKPSNLLIDHDSNIFISDFETIKKLNENERKIEASYSFGCMYSSPEQIEGKPIGYATDIFSLGLIFYFLFEKKNITQIYDYVSRNKNDKPVKMTNCSNEIQLLIEKCIKYRPEERADLKNIESVILKETEIKSFFKNNDFQIIKIYDLVQFLLENIFIRNASNNRDEFMKYMIDIVLFHSNNLALPEINQNFDLSKEYYKISYQINNSNFLLQLGNKYYYLKDYIKAVFFWQLSSEQKNSYAFLNLGNLYYNGIGFEKDYKKARDYFESSAGLNNSIALNYLGNIYCDGLGVDIDYDVAQEYYIMSAELNDSNGNLNLGYLYLYGLGVEQNYDIARGFFELSAEQDNDFAYFNLGNMYLNGVGVEIDLDKAKEYFEYSANLNNSSAQIQIGMMYYSGIVVEQDYNKSVDYILQSANQNNPYAFLVLSFFYFEGLAVEKDYNEAEKYLQLAENANDPIILYSIGLLYYNGKYVQRDLEKAKYYFLKSEKLDNSDSQVILGDIYYNQKDYSIAKYYYEKASKKNNSDALLKLGYLYISGEGVSTSFQKAKEYWELASRQGSTEASFYLNVVNNTINSYTNNILRSFNIFNSNQNVLNTNNFTNRMSSESFYGALYFQGIFVKKDLEKAKEYFKLGSKKNCPLSLFFLGIFYYYGIYFDKNYETGLHYINLSAKQNFTPSLYMLGDIYFYGRGVRPNIENALKYYEAAANQNYFTAILRLGDIYYEGKAVKQDYVKAYRYYNTLEKTNNSEVILKLAHMYFEGIGTKQDIDKALKYYEDLAKKKNCQALLELGHIYYYGKFVKRNIEKALTSYELYVRYFDIEYSYNSQHDFETERNKQYLNDISKKYKSAIQYRIGITYFQGKYIKKFYEKAVKYFELSANLGNSDAMYFLGLAYYYGKGVTKNKKKAFDYFKSSANLKNSSSLYQMGYFYEKGDIVEQNYKIAINYYELSANQGDSDAFYKLGELYLSGKGVTQSIKKAEKYFELSCELNNSSAFLKLSNYYATGLELFYDLEKSMEYLQRLIDFKNKDESLYNRACMNGDYYIANNNLGLFYITETEIQNIELAEKYLKEAAYNEYPYGQNNYGLLCQFYLDNKKMAIYMFEKSMKNECSLAYFNLGHLYEEDGEIDKSITCYINASDNEGNFLEYREKYLFEIQINQSEKFIICLTNLKLAIYFMCQNNNIPESKKYFGRAISQLILDYYQFSFHYSYKNRWNNCLFSYIGDFIFSYPGFTILNHKKTYIKHQFPNNGSVFKSPLELFDFVIENNEITALFIQEIEKIINEMNEILYKPPYNILFGRIKFKNIELKPIQNLKNINEHFYEGFDII